MFIQRLVTVYQLFSFSKRQFWKVAFLIALQSLWTAVVVSFMGIFFHSAAAYYVDPKFGAGGEGSFKWLLQAPHSLSPQYRIFWGAALTGLSLILDQALRFLMNVVVFRFNLSYLYQVRSRLFGAICSRPLSYYDNAKKGYLIQMIANESKACYRVLHYSFLMLTSLFYILVANLMLFALSWKLSIILMVLGGILMGMSKSLATRVRRRAAASTEENRGLMSTVEETVNLLKQLKLLNYHERMLSLFNQYSQRANAASFRVLFIGEAQQVFAAILVFMLIGALGFSAVKYSFISLPSLFILFYLLYLLQSQLNALVNRYTTLMSELPNLEKIETFLKEYEGDKERGGTLVKSPLLENHLTFENVCLSYPGRKNILQDISFRVNKGETVALVGASGAGKTSLVNLALRLYEPSAGKILIDDHPLAEYDLSYLRKKIGIVNQEPFIFNLSASDNIQMAKPEATFEEIKWAAKKAFAHEFIMRLPLRYNSIVGERGVKLSQGQKQRINLAQIFLKDPDILVLDEATSSLDSESEKMIQQSLYDLARQRTLIVIAHRLATIKHADWIILLDNGKIIKKGSWDELIRESKEFSKMVELQAIL